MDQNIKHEDAVKAAVEEAKASQETVEAEGVEQPQEQGTEKPTAEKKEKKSKKETALKLELEKKEAEVAELKDKYQRLMAEFENARKRNEKEAGRRYDIGAMEVLEKLLPIVDNFERALDTVSEEEKQSGFPQGVAMIYKQLMETLEGIGVSAMNPVGKEFNADFHNAVMHEENEEMGENLVSEEFQKGYMYKEQVLRHSMVKVVN
jgi:molecular chaperone GrpE